MISRDIFIKAIKETVKDFDKYDDDPDEMVKDIMDLVDFAVEHPDITKKEP